jgi:uncharacterized protein YgbK (DUF1537 family)
MMLVVLDDDPTGTQSVHGISVLTEWSTDMLRVELGSAMPAVYLLTNPRVTLAGPGAQRGDRSQHPGGGAPGRRPVVVSRSDLTLRGHFPARSMRWRRRSAAA